MLKYSNSLFVVFRQEGPTIWKYYAKTHFLGNHPTSDFVRYEYLWKLSNFEVAEIKKI